MTRGVEYGGVLAIHNSLVLAVLLALGGLAIGCGVVFFLTPNIGADAVGRRIDDQADVMAKTRLLDGQQPGADGNAVHAAQIAEIADVPNPHAKTSLARCTVQLRPACLAPGPARRGAMRVRAGQPRPPLTHILALPAAACLVPSGVRAEPIEVVASIRNTPSAPQR
jgi:hypothetical protein